MSFSVAGVMDALRAQPAQGPGRALMLIAAQHHAGNVALTAAVAGAAGPGAVYAIDLDLRRNALPQHFAPLGPRIDGALNGRGFYAIVDKQGRPLAQAASYFYHRVGRSRLYVGAFDGAAVPQGGRVLLSNAPDYWDAARAGGATVVVDAPALERSRVALRVARHMDGVVLLVGDAPGAAPAAMAAKTALREAGANLIGLVYAGASAPVMAIERVMRQAG